VGDEINVIKEESTHLEVEVTSFKAQPDGSLLPVTGVGFIEPTKTSGIKPSAVVIPLQQNRVLKANFVDVQQGDGSVIESPDGKIILVDGGDNQLFARYLAARFRGTTAAQPKKMDCIGHPWRADHFSGLTKIHESETLAEKRKRLFIHPERIYHNGLVKRPSKRNNKAVPDAELLGPTRGRDESYFNRALRSWARWGVGRAFPSRWCLSPSWSPSLTWREWSRLTDSKKPKSAAAFSPSAGAPLESSRLEPMAAASWSTPTAATSG
jgi:hypothetical protein